MKGRKAKATVTRAREALGEISGNEQEKCAQIGGFAVKTVTGLPGEVKIEFGSDFHFSQGCNDTNTPEDSPVHHYDLVPVDQDYPIDPLLLEGDFPPSQQASPAAFSEAFFESCEQPFNPSELDQTFDRHSAFFSQAPNFGTQPCGQYLSSAHPPVPSPEDIVIGQKPITPKRRKRRQHRARAARHAAAAASTERQEDPDKEVVSEPDSSDELESQDYDLFTMSWPSITGANAGPPKTMSQTPNAGIGGIGGHLKHYLQLDGLHPASQCNSTVALHSTDRLLLPPGLEKPTAAKTPHPDLLHLASQVDVTQWVSPVFCTNEHRLHSDSHGFHPIRPALLRHQSNTAPFPSFLPGARVGTLGLHPANYAPGIAAAFSPSTYVDNPFSASSSNESPVPGLSNRQQARGGAFDHQFVMPSTDDRMSDDKL